MSARQILPPPPAEQARAIVIPRGPNIQPPPPQAPLPESLAGRVLIVVGDDVSTGDLSPDGAAVMAFRSNVPAMAGFVFRRLDPKFAVRAREWGGGFIVGGDNYGQGSSREHASMCPMYLGVKAVVAKSFERIHSANLVNFGVLPLVFRNQRATSPPAVWKSRSLMPSQSTSPAVLSCQSPAEPSRREARTLPLVANDRAAT